MDAARSVLLGFAFGYAIWCLGFLAAVVLRKEATE